MQVFLITCVNALHWLACERIPEANATIGSSTAADKQTMVVWRPGDGFDSCHVLWIRLNWVQRVLVPNVKSIVVSATGKILIVYAKRFISNVFIKRMSWSHLVTI